MTPRQTEKIKLTATYLNGLAVAIFAVGGFAPLFTDRRPSPHDGLAFWLFLSITVSCWLASAGLHFFARTVLDRLPNDDA